VALLMNGGGQMQGQGEAIVPIRPGSPNTSLDRSAIGDNDAQDILNCTIVNGVWEIDQRYRQFAPVPTAFSDQVNVTHSLPCFRIYTPGTPGSVHSCSGGTVSGYCSSGWGYVDGVGMSSCMTGTPVGPPI
jgi:hypothetical protein